MRLPWADKNLNILHIINSTYSFKRISRFLCLSFFLFKEPVGEFNEEAVTGATVKSIVEEAAENRAV